MRDRSDSQEVTESPSVPSSAASKVETERVVVKTTVPAYQKREWAEHANDLDMSLSEFIRTMVQAGKRGYEPDCREGGFAANDPRGDGLETVVQDVLSESPRTLEELNESLLERLQNAVDRLRDENAIGVDIHSGTLHLEET